MTAKGKVDAVKAAEDNNGLNDMARTVQRPGVEGLGMLHIGVNGVRPCELRLDRTMKKEVNLPWVN